MLRTIMLPTHHPTDPGAGFGDAISNAPNHAAEHGQHATDPGQHATDPGQHAAEPARTIATTERQAWRIPEDQVTDFLTLHGTHGCR
jgi:hypothetical protein